MTLGSAPSSPSSPGANSNYLPAFLMGESQPATPKPSLSPDVSRNVSYNLSLSEQGGNLRQKLFSPLVTDSPTVTAQSPYDVGVTKPGPPKQSLFDTIDVKKTVSSPPFGQTFVAESSENLPRNSLNSSLCRSESFSNFETIRSDVGQNLWVTIFGFPANSASLVLARFANCGNIVDKRFPAQGNWVHLKYSSALETAKALALNGKLISNCIMVGVVPHHSKQENKENKDVLFYTSPVRARSLRHSFVSPQNSNTVLAPQNVPQKSTGLVTKAMEYVFGW